MKLVRSLDFTGDRERSRSAANRHESDAERNRRLNRRSLLHRAGVLFFLRLFTNECLN